MCFSNLPIEFDDEGNPHLADEAEAVDRPSGSGAESARASDCGRADDAPLDEADPEAVYEAIVESVPRDVRRQLADSDGTTTPVAPSEGPERGQTD